jgi:hypothetical protein
MYGLASDPFPAVTHLQPLGDPGAVNWLFDVIVIASCCAPPPPLEVAAPASANAISETITSSERYIETPFPGRSRTL